MYTIYIYIYTLRIQYIYIYLHYVYIYSYIYTTHTNKYIYIHTHVLTCFDKAFMLVQGEAKSMVRFTSLHMIVNLSRIQIHASSFYFQQLAYWLIDYKSMSHMRDLSLLQKSEMSDPVALSSSGRVKLRGRVCFLCYTPDI